ncbi:MAG: HNH endonuclease [Acidimicrobiaceae bacterium]|nr:HNH endonuclease [Acidimicrobiaceae bacterium]MYE09656.1 HNH endonuclease [Acidimicrobiaceae bacterium]MYI37066.1 HNH endonuclease [Acidimicrobiaceae bacterium]
MSVRRINTGRVHSEGFWFFKTVHFIATKQIKFSVGRRRYEQLCAERERDGVARIGRRDDRVMWWAQPVGDEHALYWATPEMSAQDVALVIWGRHKRQGSQLDRLRKRKDRGEDPAPPAREHIPAEIRDEVYRRDQGRCRSCQREDELQFDHIIPVSKGGATAAENLQILCGPCNRAKADNIG